MSDGEGPVQGRIALWTAVAQFATLVAGVATSILTPPPLLYSQVDDQLAANAPKATAIALFLFVFVVARRFDAKGKHNRLALIAFVLFIASLASIFAYAKQVEDWSCRFPDHNAELFVRGKDYTAAANELRIANSYGNDCGKVMFAFATDGIGEVWKQDEMKRRYYTLLAWYLLSASGMIAALLLGIEAVQRTISQTKE